MLTHILNDQGCFCYHTLGRGALRFKIDAPNIPEMVTKEHGIIFTQPTMHPEVLCAYLREIKHSIQVEKPVGVIHTYFGSSVVKQSFEKAGGIHFAIIRNPSNRIKSQVTAKIKNLVDQHHQNFDTFDETQQQDCIKNVIESDFDKIEIIFSRETSVTLASDYDNIINLNDDDLVHFEGMFKPTENSELVKKIHLITDISETEISKYFRLIENSINILISKSTTNMHFRQKIKVL